jgi:hypothetical protein
MGIWVHCMSGVMKENIPSVLSPSLSSFHLFIDILLVSTTDGHKTRPLPRRLDDLRQARAVRLVMCRAGLKALSPALPGPLRPGPRPGLARAKFSGLEDRKARSPGLEPGLAN